MIDIEKEALISLQDACKFVKKLTGGARNPCHSVLWRWCCRGQRGIRLEHLRIGGKIFTSEAAISRFLNAVAEQAVKELDEAEAEREATRGTTAPTPGKRSAEAKAQAIEAAKERLAS